MESKAEKDSRERFLAYLDAKKGKTSPYTNHVIEDQTIHGLSSCEVEYYAERLGFCVYKERLIREIVEAKGAKTPEEIKEIEKEIAEKSIEELKNILRELIQKNIGKEPGE